MQGREAGFGPVPAPAPLYHLFSTSARRSVATAGLLALLVTTGGCAGGGTQTGPSGSPPTSRPAATGGSEPTPRRQAPLATATRTAGLRSLPGVHLPAGTAAPRGPLISTVRWVRRGNALRVVPTAALRGAATTASARQAWREVLAVQPDADRPGMFHQFRCHVEYAPKKGAWYLDPGRPDLGYLVTVLAKCNPGPDQDGG